MLDGLVDKCTFWLGAFVLFWAHILGSLMRRIRFIDFTEPRNDMFEWSRLMMDFLGVSVYHVHGELYRGGDALFMANHRSWGDFFIDTYLTEGRASLMSRMLVFYVFPVFMTSALIIKSLVLINRGNVGDKDRFNARLDRIRAGTHAKGIVIYPEGTRNLAPGYKPLRKGMLVYAFSRKLPVQIIIAANKESVMGSEKRMDAHFGQNIWVGYSPVIRPEDYATFEAFWEHFQTLWDAEWKKVYGTDPEKLKLHVPQPPLFDYPFSMRLMQLVSVSTGTLLFGYSLGYAIRCLQAVYERLGPAVMTVLMAPVVGLALLLLEQGLLGGGRRRAKKLAARQIKAVAGALVPRNANPAAAAAAAGDGAGAGAGLRKEGAPVASNGDGVLLNNGKGPARRKLKE